MILGHAALSVAFGVGLHNPYLLRTVTVPRIALPPLESKVCHVSSPCPICYPPQAVGRKLGGSGRCVIARRPTSISRRTRDIGTPTPAPKYQILENARLLLTSEREIEILCHFTRLEWLKMHDVAFNAAADLLDLMSQSINLKVLHIKDVELRNLTSEDLIGPILHDHVDAVPKRLRNLKLQDLY